MLWTGNFIMDTLRETCLQETVVLINCNQFQVAPIHRQDYPQRWTKSEIHPAFKKLTPKICEHKWRRKSANTVWELSLINVSVIKNLNMLVIIGLPYNTDLPMTGIIVSLSYSCINIICYWELKKLLVIYLSIDSVNWMLSFLLFDILSWKSYSL